MVEYKYLLTGDPTDLAKLKTGHSTSWNETQAKRYGYEVQLGNQNPDSKMMSRALHMDVIFFLPFPKQPNKDKGDGCLHTQRPAIHELMYGLISLFENRIFPNHALIASMSVKKYHSTILRTECIFTELK